jgi:release factor glutamine methyltransferase
VDEVLRLAAGASVPLIVDVGTGSGCLAVTLAVRLPACRVFASDVSEGALEVAARNASRHGVSGRITFEQGDGLAPAREAGLAGRADFLVSNPPYIHEADLAGLQPELAFEPRGALTPGPDGLSFTAHLVVDAAPILAPGGRLLVELGAGSAQAARALLDPALWDDVAILPDAQGIGRVLSARRRS